MSEIGLERFVVCLCVELVAEISYHFFFLLSSLVPSIFDGNDQISIPYGVDSIN